MVAVHLTTGILLLALNLVAGAVGAWAWYRVNPTAVFWPLLRAAQGAVVVQILLGALLLALGHEPQDGLHILYGALPLAVIFIAEQLRVSAAETILAARGHANAQEVGELPESEQRIVVLSIVRREMGVMAVACFIVVVLALRAATTSGGL